MPIFLGNEPLVGGGGGGSFSGGGFARFQWFNTAGAHTFDLAANDIQIGDTIGILAIEGGQGGYALAGGVGGVAAGGRQGGDGGRVVYLTQQTTGDGNLNITVGAGGAGGSVNGTGGAGGTPPNTQDGARGGNSTCTGEGINVDASTGFQRGYGGNGSGNSGGSAGLFSVVQAPTDVNGISVGGSHSYNARNSDGLNGLGNGGRGAAGQHDATRTTTAQDGGAGGVVIFWNPNP